MQNPFKNFFSKKSASVLGVDVGSSSIKVVQLARRGGKAILETYGELALGPYANTEIGRATNLPPEKLAEALKDVIREAKITTNLGGLSIPYSSSLISILEMPAVSERQLAQMIPLEARKYIPVPLSEVALDWWTIPKAPSATAFNDEEEKTKRGDKLDILMVAIHNETITKYQTVVKEAGLNASFFEIEIFSTIRSALEQDSASHMIVDLGAASTKVYIVERGMVRLSHVINRGAQDVTIALSNSLGMTMQEAEIMKRNLSSAPEDKKASALDIISLSMDYVFSEANHVLVSYQKRYNKNITRVTMVGGGARTENILKLAEVHFQTEVVLGDPFGKTEAPAFLEEVLKHTGPEFAVSVGIALRKLQEIE